MYFLSIQPKLFHRVSEKETEILMTCAFNHLKARNSLPLKVKIRSNIKTEPYNPLLFYNNDDERSCKEQRRWKTFHISFPEN